jgi:hypothetical protein
VTADRSHRDAYRTNDSVRTVDLGPVKLTVDSTNASGGTELVSQRLSDDSEVMHAIADRMVAMVRENILTGDFTPLLPATIERRKYPFLPARGIGARMAAGGTRPLVAGRSLVDGIVPRSKKGYAAAQRGQDEWYGFLHDGGVGRVDRRTFMELKAGQANTIADVYDDWLVEGFAE